MKIEITLRPTGYLVGYFVAEDDRTPAMMAACTTQTAALLVANDWAEGRGCTAVVVRS